MRSALAVPVARRTRSRCRTAGRAGWPVTGRVHATGASEPEGGSCIRPWVVTRWRRLWDVFLAALAEYLAARDGCAAGAWSEPRSLRQFWFPFNTRAARVDAVVHAPAAFRRRGVYVAAQELEVA
jgi:hypothetical protein